MAKIIKNPKVYRPGIMLGIPTTGVIRYEWYSAMTSAVIPANWQCAHTTAFQVSPVGYDVANARNIIVRQFLESTFEWLFFIDHDVLLPPHVYIWVDQLMQKRYSPVMGGLYYTKGFPASPLIYRGRGTGSYNKFKLGQKVWCDGLGMGCTLIHRELLEVMWDPKTPMFYTPREVFHDPEKQLWSKNVGTEDLYFLDRAIKYLGKTKNWKHLKGKEYPFYVDTELFCRHMEISGTSYPLDIDLPPGFLDWKRRMHSKIWKVP